MLKNLFLLGNIIVMLQISVAGAVTVFCNTQNSNSSIEKNRHPYAYDNYGRNKGMVCKNYAEVQQACNTSKNFNACMNTNDKNRILERSTWLVDMEWCNVDGSVKTG